MDAMCTTERIKRVCWLPAGVVLFIGIQVLPMITIAKDIPTDDTISLGAAVVTFTVATHLAEIDI